MTTKTDLPLLYETLLTVPGMNQTVKINLKLSRKNVLILSKIIERGLQSKGDEKEGVSIIQVVPPETLEELNSIAGDLLQKAGLSEMNEKLSSFL